jgi:hypothetical protein
MPTRHLAALSVAFTLALGPTAVQIAYAQVPGKGGGWGKGIGKGGGGGGGAGGAPLPLLGGTILGQLVAAGGGYVLWRRYRSKKATKA